MKRYIRSADDINSTELFRTISRIVIVDDASTFLDGTNSQDEIFMNYSKSAIRRLSEDEISRIFSAVALARIYEIAPEKLSPFQCNFVKDQLARKNGIRRDDIPKVLNSLKACDKIDKSQEGTATRIFLANYGITEDVILDIIDSLEIPDLKYWTQDYRKDDNDYNMDTLIVAYPNGTFVDPDTNTAITLKMYIKIDYTLTKANGSTIALVSFHENNSKKYRQEQEYLKRNGPYKTKKIPEL